MPDRAILKSTEDELDRGSFAKQLKDSLSSWENEESLVIALKGEWGEGKSSVLNLVKEQFEGDKQNRHPTIIEFNPWAYSNQGTLSLHFFDDISSELKLKGATTRDIKLAKTLKVYSELLAIDVDSKTLSNAWASFILLLGILGITVSTILDYLSTEWQWIEIFFLVVFFVLFLFQFLSGLLNKIVSFFNLKSISMDDSPQAIKRKIVKLLTDRKKKLLIIIDDIDRLSQKEMSEVFKLIRVNADFPNTIYLLAFDSRIIEANLEEQVGISGKDYLKKIVQVDFNLPYTRNDKIQQFLFNELDKLTGKLPDTIHTYLNKENGHWTNTYHSGYKSFFKNIRDVKRYVNSLLFNINLLQREGIFEVNPIDFFALEALRVFTPDFYDFLKTRKDLFTDPVDVINDKPDGDRRKNELMAAFDEVEKDLRITVIKLINHLFPQLDTIINENGGMTYAKDYYFNWRKDMRICSKEHFDLYFTLNPQDNISEFSNYDLEKFLTVLKGDDEIDGLLQKYIDNQKFRPLIRRIQDFTEDRDRIPKQSALKLIKGLNNLSDQLEDDIQGFFDIRISLELARITNQLLSNEKKEDNFDTIKGLINESTGIFGILNLISIQTQGYEKNALSDKLLVTREGLTELQKLIVEKLEQTDIKTLLENRHFLFIVNRWKDWERNGKLEDVITEILSDKRMFLDFLKHFIVERRSTVLGSYDVNIQKQISFKNLERFMTVDEAARIMDEIKRNPNGFKEYFEVIWRFNQDIDHYKKTPNVYADFGYAE